MNKLIQGKLKNSIRAELRKLLVADKLEARITYYDYYDSCHAPIETPDAPWVPADLKINALELKAGGPSLFLIKPGHYELSTGYMQIEVRIKAGV